MPKNQRARLIQGPVGKTLVRLTIPMIFGILSMVVFNLVDTFYVGKLGAKELAALSFTFPVVMIIHSLALGLGIGASAVISRSIGEGALEKVKRLTTDSLILSFLVVLIFVITGQLTITPVFRLLGATEDILPLIRQYMQIWYWGVVFVVIPMVGNNAIRAAGDTKTPSLIMMCAAGINLILDPFLIFGIGPFPRLEIAGAALSTLIARAVTLVVSLIILRYREKMITFVKVPFKKIIQSWGQILYIALPTAGTRIIIPLGIGIITRLVSTYGPEAVAGFGVASRLEFFSVAVVMALASVLGPFTGQNWGAGKVDRVKLSVSLSNRFSLGWGILLFFGLVFLAKPIALVFSKDTQVIKTVVAYLRIAPFGYGFQGILLLTTAVLNVLKKPLHAAGISFIQMFFLYIPLAFLGSALLGLMGIFGAIAASYLLAGLASWLLLSYMIRKEAKIQFKK